MEVVGAVQRRILRLDVLRRCTGRLVGALGRRPRAIDDLLAARLPGYDPGDSDLETRVLRLVAASALDLPVQQYRVRLAGRTYRIDLAYPDIKLAVELDGWDAHRSRSAFEHDRARANALVVAGWTVIPFTSRFTDAEILDCIAAARSGLVDRGSYMTA
ncbi:MAG: endonuclease domain-containing protein [Actinomycetota bacterium]|nr:endonuclease domain-containing protein [Actinomycetota bacterium]